MPQTLFTRLSDTNQYDVSKKIVTWKDTTSTRWQNVYSKISTNDQVIFLLKGKALLGIVDSILNNVSITVKDVVEYNITNDDFLKLNSISPENISTIKANFHPFITPIDIDFSILKKELQVQNFISFYVIMEENKEKDKDLFKKNDRVVIVDNNNYVHWMHQFDNGDYFNFKNFKADLFGSKNKTLTELNQIHLNSKKKNNIAALDRMIKGLSADGIV